jgi:cytochrome P450
MTISDTEATEALDLTDPTLYHDGVPHELFRELRVAAPVHRHRRIEPEGWHRQWMGDDVDLWVVLAHAEIERANRDWETFTASEGPSFLPSEMERQGVMLVSMDPPDHSRMRRLISAGFTPRMIAKLDELIETRTAQIIDAALERGEVEFVSDVGYQLPMHVIADIVGIPDSDRPWVFERTDLMLRMLDPGSDVSTDVGTTAQAELFQYATRLGDEKRANPADDVWTKLATASLVDDDGNETTLSGLELDMFFIILTIAGSETTRNAISQGVMALHDHPEQLAALREDPALIDSAVDEIIRWASPVLFFGRTATRDVDLGGAPVRAGDRVTLWYPSGNRDERVFDDPFAFDIRRSPNPHVSFGGGGPHYCLGANLAKREVKTMVHALVDRCDVEILDGPTWAGGGPVNQVGVSLDRLPARLTARP